MTIKVKNELLLINLLVVLLVIIIVFLPSNALRIVLGLPFVLFFPGYVLIAALFPGKDDLTGVERIALSFGLSIAVVPLIGLVLNYTPWGIRLYPVLICVSLFIFVMSIVAMVRRRRLALEQRFSISFTANVSKWREMSGLDRILTVLLASSIVTAMGTLGYVIAKPKIGEKFSEFYILGPEGKATNYPRELLIGQEGEVILGIVNHEQQPTEYIVEISIDGVKNKRIGPISLAQGGKWEQTIKFMPTSVGEKQKVEFLLYRVGSPEPYLRLHLWVDVKTADSL